MKIAFTVLVAALTVLPAEVARADSFSLEGAFSTSGVFRCLGRELACSGSGTDTLTLGSGANMATLTFEGVDRDITITNRARTVNLGQFVVTGPDDFTFPARLNDNPPILNFDFSLMHMTPVMDTNLVRLGFGPGGGTQLPFLSGRTHTSFSLAGVDLGGADYSRIVYSLNLRPFSISGQGATVLTADVGVVPEPGTILLVGAGLAGAMARRRRTAARERLAIH